MVQESATLVSLLGALSTPIAPEVVRRRDGTVLVRGRDGALIARAELADGRLHGSFELYGPNGFRLARATFDRGVLSGPLRAWHPDGTPWARAMARPGRPVHWIRRTADAGHTACSTLEPQTSVVPTVGVEGNRKAERSAA